ncbi:MAG: hypothetical protein EOO05_16720, partial [Chitinophagaceae bacterium]
VYSQSIVNASFETGDLSGWKFSKSAPAAHATDAGFTASVKTYTGAGYVAQLVNTGSGVWAQLGQRVPYKTADTLAYLKLTARVKISDTAEGSAGIAVRMLNGTKSVGFFEQTLTGDGEWNTVTIDFLANYKVDSLAVFCWIKGHGTASFDSLQLQKGTTMQVEQSTVARVYLDTALNIIERNALYKDSVDFPAILDYARLLAANARQPSDCYASVSYVLTALEDGHSHFYTAGQAKFMTRKQDEKMELPSGKRIGEDIGYLKIPKCMALSSELEKMYADSLLSVIRKTDSKKIKGWIVDARDNTGGNAYPMILGLGPILGNGIFERTVRKGVVIDSLDYRDGIVRSKDSIVSRSAVPYKLYHPSAKVAVLFNGMTASSGESVVLAFKGRPGSKSFGQPSYGLTTGNGDFTLADGAILIICTGKQADRFGIQYGGKLIPDQIVTDSDQTAADEVAAAATSWLRGR